MADSAWESTLWETVHAPPCSADSDKMNVASVVYMRAEAHVAFRLSQGTQCCRYMIALENELGKMERLGWGWAAPTSNSASGISNFNSLTLWYSRRLAGGRFNDGLYFFAIILRLPLCCL